jgi:PAS domain S-box-containing protein
MGSAIARKLEGSEPQPSRMLEAVVAAAPVAIVGLDARGAVILWSPTAERLLGWSAREVIGRRPPFITAEDEREVSRWVELLARDAAVPERRMSCLRRDGTHLEVTTSIAPIRDSLEQVMGATLALSEPGIRPGVDPAPPGPYRMESLGRFAAGVAHDVNNVLTAITGYAELLSADLPADSPAQADLAEIRRATDRATRLTRQLLTFGRGQRQVREPLDVDEVIAGVESMLRRLAGPGVEVIVVRSAGLAAVDADRGQLEQILANLVVNSRDAMPLGGELQITTAAVELDEAFAASHAGASAGAHVRIAVRDTGLGMDAETLAHLFEPYFTTKPTGKGTGLGLAMVYGAVKQSGGYILAESALGAGTTMSIYLPRR